MTSADHRQGQDNWEEHWERFASANLVNPAQHYRHQLVLRFLDLDRANKPRVLDIGSGVGELLRIVHAAHPGAEKLGLEMSASGVRIASGRLPQARFLQRDLTADVEDVGVHRGFATHAVCSEVLEHVDDPVRLLRNARAYMAEGCRLVVTVPGGPRSKFDIHIGHRRHYSPAELRRLLGDAGFNVELCAGAGFPYFNLYRLAVVLRGDRLVNDASDHPSALLRAASAVFRGLFRFNLTTTRLGWQTFAVAQT